MITYAYTIAGTAAEHQTFTVHGTVEAVNQGMFVDATMAAVRDAFHQLTQGKAEYGLPGKGCSGPYSITKLTMELMP